MWCPQDIFMTGHPCVDTSEGIKILLTQGSKPIVIHLSFCIETGEKQVCEY